VDKDKERWFDPHWWARQMAANSPEGEEMLDTMTEEFMAIGTKYATEHDIAADDIYHALARTIAIQAFAAGLRSMHEIVESYFEEISRTELIDEFDNYVEEYMHKEGGAEDGDQMGPGSS
jgi:hypothetical protein